MTLHDTQANWLGGKCQALRAIGELIDKEEQK